MVLMASFAKKLQTAYLMLGVDVKSGLLEGFVGELHEDYLERLTEYC
jgi:hypothetical protein